MIFMIRTRPHAKAYAPHDPLSAYDHYYCLEACAPTTKKLLTSVLPVATFQSRLMA